MLRSYIRGVIRHAWRVVQAVAVVTALLTVQIATLRVEVDPDSQLPQGHPYVRALNRLAEVFGEKNLVFVGLFPTEGDVYTPHFLAALDRVTERIGELPGLVRRTFSSLALDRTVDIRATPDGMAVEPFLAELPRTRAEALVLRDRLAANPHLLGTLVARDGSAAAIVADFELRPPRFGAPEVRAAVERVLAEENDGSYTAHLGGPAIYVAWLAEYSERMFLFFPLALLLIGLVHYEAFRTVQAMVLPLLTAVLAMVWSLGILGTLGVALDPFNVTTPILILAIAAGHAVQMLKRFYEELDRTGDPRRAVEDAAAAVGPVMLVAGGIAAASFLSLLAFDTAAIRNFGLFTALGILSTLVIELTLVPAVRALLPAPSVRERNRERSRHVFDAVVGAIAAGLRRRGPAPFLTAGVVLALVAVALGSRVAIDSSFRRQFTEDAAVRRDERRLNEAVAGTSTLVLLVEGEEPGAIDEPELLRGIDEIQRWLEGEPEVGQTLSFVDYVRQMHGAMRGGAGPAETLPETRDLVAQYLLLYSFGGSVEDFDSLVDPTHRIAAVRAFVKEDSTRFGEELIRRLRRKIDEAIPPGYRVQVSGSLASTHALNEVMVSGKIANIVQIAVLVLVVASGVFRSLLGGLLVAIPLAFAVATNFGAMGLWGIPLDVGTSAISAMAVGIGADYAVYFLFRLREEIGHGARDPAVAGAEPARGAALLAAVDRTLRSSGKAILFVSSAVAVGYLSLCFSGFGYHVRLGLLVAFAMLVSSLASLTVLPALVLALEPRFLRRSARAAAGLEPGPEPGAETAPPAETVGGESGPARRPTRPDAVRPARPRGRVPAVATRDPATGSERPPGDSGGR